MKSYLNKPFPFIDKKKHRIVASFLFSAFIYLFLIVFQPFGIADIQFYKPLFILGFSVITLKYILKVKMGLPKNLSEIQFQKLQNNY